MPTTRNKAIHICNLIKMALKDNNFADIEQETIIKIAIKQGVSCDDLKEIIQEKKLSLQIPEKVTDRIEHLYDLVKVLQADGVEDGAEIKYINNLAKAYGFKDNYKEKQIIIDPDYENNKVNYESFFEQYDIYTGVMVNCKTAMLETSTNTV